MAHSAVAKEGHRAMRNLAISFDFRPPDAPVPKANAVVTERLRDDHMVHFFGVEIEIGRASCRERV